MKTRQTRSAANKTQLLRPSRKRKSDEIKTPEAEKKSNAKAKRTKRSSLCNNETTKKKKESQSSSPSYLGHVLSKTISRITTTGKNLVSNILFQNTTKSPSKIKRETIAEQIEKNKVAISNKSKQNKRNKKSADVYDFDDSCHDIQLIDTYRNYNNTSFVNTKSVKDEKPQNSTKKSTKNSKLEMQELEKKIIDLPEASSVPENFGDDNLNGSHQDIYQPDVGLGVIESPDQSCIINQINFNNSETAISEKILEQNSLASLTDDDNDEIVQNVNDDKIIEKPTDIPKNEIKNAESVSIPDQTDDDSGSESNEIEMNIGLGFYDDMRPQDFSNFLKDDRFESDNSIVCFEDEDENDASFSKMDDQLITSLSQPQNMKIAEQNNKTDETHNNQPYHQSQQFQLLLEEQAEYILKSQSHFLKFKKLMSSKDDNFNNSQDSSDTSSSEEDDDSDVDSDDDMNDDKNDDDKENKCEVDQKGENIVNANYFTENQKSFLLKVYEDSQNDFKVNSHNQNNKNGEFDSDKAKQICESVPDPIEKCETPMPDPDQSGTKNNNSEKSMSHRRPLPFKTRRTPEMTLVLDLDETLVHATLTPIDDADMIFKVEMPDGLKYPIHVKIRPGLKPFLEKASKHFELVIFTASKKIYASRLIQMLDPHKKLIRHRLYRDHCRQNMQNYIKDLSVLGRDLRKTIIVDNSPQAFSFQIENGIPIKSWFGNTRANLEDYGIQNVIDLPFTENEDNDTALEDLWKELEKILEIRSKVTKKRMIRRFDVRKILVEKYNLQKRIEETFIDLQTKIEENRNGIEDSEIESEVDDLSNYSESD